MGKVADIITNIVMLFMRGKIKQMDSLIDPEQRKKVVDAAKEVKSAVERYNKLLDRPDIKEFIEESGKSVEDFRIDKL